MSMSKAQKEGVVVVCKCGCNTEFKATPIYRKKSEGGGLRTPEYMRGHHPNVKQFGKVPAWNKGLKKGDHPSIERMGYQKGHVPHNDWSHVNDALKNDPELRKRWLDSKKGQVAWNKGLTLNQYPNGIAAGEKHGNWKGGHRGIVDTSEWQKMRLSILKRDKYTCQYCGDVNRKGRGSRINLEVHHIVALCESIELALDPDNLVTLCRPCHYKTHNYGSKAYSNNTDK